MHHLKKKQNHSIPFLQIHFSTDHVYHPPPVPSQVDLGCKSAGCKYTTIVFNAIYATIFNVAYQLSTSFKIPSLSASGSPFFQPKNKLVVQFIEWSHLNVNTHMSLRFRRDLRLLDLKLRDYLEIGGKNLWIVWTVLVGTWIGNIKAIVGFTTHISAIQAVVWPSI